jgi:hypothetical protein
VQTFLGFFSIYFSFFLKTPFIPIFIIYKPTPKTPITPSEGITEPLCRALMAAVHGLHQASSGKLLLATA